MTALTVPQDNSSIDPSKYVARMLRASGMSVDSATGDVTFGAKVKAAGGPVTLTATLATAALTGITSSAPGTPDYAIADPTQTTPFGFTTADEFLTAMKAIANLQAEVGELKTYVAELKAALVTAGLAV